MNPPAETTLSALHLAARRRLADAGISDAGLDARLIVEHFSATTRTDAVLRPDTPVAAAVVRQVEAALDRRIAGELALGQHRVAPRRRARAAPRYRNAGRRRAALRPRHGRT